ncbi:uncharacterized protein B0H64DRAFT_239296 [Chaetomium fimeti]|uniref:Zn(2)-C6 fungal-type domain-containing protein n=1 Tax=Chaetomium fimeti TaxID=1854472 RepID=A0AAE0LNL4_9PEZI|nr:hypothetical protein B0H64DRAFT_239296 [Chaetomium fimeti]
MSARKRVISSCVPCYTRKQKCNREYPCNHCARRQCTEDCVYHSTTETQPSSPGVLPESQAEDRSRESAAKNQRGRQLSGPRNEWKTRQSAKSVTPTAPWSGPSLAESFGYSEGSATNTLALIQRLGLAGPDGAGGNSPTLSPEAADEVHRNMERMPDHQIVDFLVQYFVAEVNWMDQLVHVPWFLPKYHSWWLLERVTLVAEADFVILILRICSYTLRFLPSPGYPLDKIRGVLLSDVRNMCDETVENLATISTAADSRASLIRVQHLAFLGLQHQVEGRTSAFWEALSRAIRVAQNVGLHREFAARPWEGVDKTVREMERRTFCNLYVWDSLLSRQLDRIPVFPGRLRPGNRPQLHLLRNGDGIEPAAVDAPDQFTERFLQAELAEFWRGVGPIQGTEYDMMSAEERYDKFCRHYPAQLPPPFALADPDETWDKRFPKLPLQRKLLHMAIYESICWNFRPLLVARPGAIHACRSMLLSLQKRKLAAAALYVLESATQVHALFGGCLTRLSGLVFSTFEAAVLLVSLSMDPMFPEEIPQHHIPPPGTLKTDPLQARMYVVTQLGCLQAAKAALQRLKMLSAVSNMADVGASTLAQLLGRASELRAHAEEAADVAAMAAHNQSMGNMNTTGCATTAIAATAAMGGTSAAGEVASWVSADLSDLRSVSDITLIAGTIAAGDMASWSSFDTWNNYMQDTPMELWAANEANAT